jgi:hypothetical protein
VKNLTCPVCTGAVYFDSESCLQCNQLMLFDADLGQMVAGQEERLCLNGSQHRVCNWLAVASGEFCLACQSNLIIPDLSVADNHVRWKEIELAKRRLYYSLLSLGLGRHLMPGAVPTLQFEFKASVPGDKVITGQNEGLITLDIAEAEDTTRVQRRAQLGEDYRTVLGHLRHEVGHFFWMVLVRDANQQTAFRALFGDEQSDYGESLATHYANGAPGDWRDNYISAYASSHPHEDWAESFAHYLHIYDTLGTAKERHLIETGLDPSMNFDAWIADWQQLSIDLNLLAHNMGYRDLYPFVLTPLIIDKLQFVHTAISSSARVGANEDP